ncbi:hypothetical protein HK104_004467 [Borealophlyctis nickersoniae]|nr:hypothetical protein HK104_004467 [Borealophlyctis nickersoniae]
MSGETSPNAKLTLHFRTASGDKKTLEADLEMTLGELKANLVPMLDIPKDQMRLVWAGRVFKDDEATLASLDLKTGETVHVAKLASNNQTTAQSASVGGSQQLGGLGGLGGIGAGGGAGNPFGMPGNMSALFDNPAIRSLLENPAFMQSMLESDPRLAAMAERNPEIRHLLRDPAFLRQTLETIRNPAAMQEMMRNHDRQLSNIEAIPGGMNYLSSMYRNLEEPLGAGRAEDPSTDEANEQFARRLGARQRTTEGVNAEALPNPWAPASAQNSTAAGAGAIGAGAANPVSNPLANPLANPFAGLFGNPFGIAQNPPATAASSTGPGAAPPQGVDLVGMMQQLQQLQLAMQALQPGGGGAFGAGGFGVSDFGGGAPLGAQTGPTAPTQPEEPAEPPEVRFAEQLKTMAEMGFLEKEQCVRALLAAGGNVEAAIAYMLDSA